MSIIKKKHIIFSLFFAVLLLFSCSPDEPYRKEKEFGKTEKAILEKLDGSWSRRVAIDEIESLDTFQFEIFDNPTILKSQGKQTEFHGKMTWTNTTVYLDETEVEELCIYFYVEPYYDRICGYGFLSSERYDTEDAQVFDYVFFNNDSLKLTESTIGHANPKELKRVLEDSDNLDEENSENEDEENSDFFSFNNSETRKE